jgi:hypothetical protein
LWPKAANLRGFLWKLSNHKSSYLRDTTLGKATSKDIEERVASPVKFQRRRHFSCQQFLHFDECIVLGWMVVMVCHVTDRMRMRGKDCRPVAITAPTLGSIPTRLWQLKQAEKLMSAADHVGKRG